MDFMIQKLEELGMKNKAERELQKIENTIIVTERMIKELENNKLQVDGWCEWLKTHEWKELLKELHESMDEKTYLEATERTKIFYYKWKDYNFEGEMNKLNKKLDELKLNKKKAVVKVKLADLEKDF